MIISIKNKIAFKFSHFEHLSGVPPDNVTSLLGLVQVVEVEWLPQLAKDVFDPSR